MSDKYAWLRAQGYTDEMIDLHETLVRAMQADPEFQRIEAEENVRIITALESTPLVVSK